MATNILQGGAAKLYDRAANVWGNADSTHTILSFMLFDPAASGPSDPRPSMSNTFVSLPLGRILARTDWTANASWFGCI
jgi:hypothetical protein